MPKRERLLKGQNQLILERMQKKNIIHTTKPDKSKVLLHKTRLSNNPLKENNKGSVDKRKNDLNDSDKMVFEISDYTNDNNKSLNEDNYSIVKRYQYTPKDKKEMRLIKSNKKFANINMAVIKSDFIHHQSQSNHNHNSGLFSTKVNGNDIKYPGSNNIKIIRLLVQKYNDTIKRQQNYKENNNGFSSNRESNQGLNVNDKDKENDKNSTTKASNITNGNSYMTLPQKSIFKKMFIHSKSTTDINWNNESKLVLTNKNNTIQKIKRKMFNWNFDSKSKSKSNDAQFDSITSKQILSNSLNNFTNILRLTNIAKWKEYDLAWKQFREETNQSKKYDHELIPPNTKELLLYYYYSLLSSSKENNGKNINVALLKNDFDYFLDYYGNSNPQREIKLWKEAYCQLQQRWQLTNLSSTLNDEKIPKETRIKIKKVAKLILKQSNVIFANVMNTLSAILKNKLLIHPSLENDLNYFESIN